jgi:hypothetical protein
VGGKGEGRGKGGEMTQTLYAHMNKRIIKKMNLDQKKSLVVIHYDFLYQMTVTSTHMICIMYTKNISQENIMRISLI